MTAGVLSSKWVPKIVAALLVAQKIADREKPWESYEPDNQQEPGNGH